MFSHQNLSSDDGQIDPNAAGDLPIALTLMNNASYYYRQQMIHWKDGTFTSSGNISLFYTFPSSEEVQIQTNYDLNIWQKSCENPNQLQGTITTISNSTSRYISSTSIKIGNLDLTGKYNQWFIGNTLVGNYPRLIYIEEMLYLHGIDGINEPIQYTPVFEFQGNEIITIMGQSIDAIKIGWTGQRFYAGTICGLGTGPYINISSIYYYHPYSGILLSAKTEIIEYMDSDPGIYQHFSFTRTIRGANDDGKWETTDNPTDTTTGWIPTDPREREIFITIVASAGILILGAIAMILIHRQGMKWKVKALLEYEELQKNQTPDPDNQ